ncbi:zinc-binding dehydrogenase [Kitasatospora sp. NPDC086791]|uniref:zinc-binding dehydrogenase n=1 Tax=Kitasatospora sp. NPDC086791 TaxID=3155178 RepID=UPI0034242574
MRRWRARTRPRSARRPAKQAGAVVVATAGPASADRVRSYGADQIVDHTTTTPAEAVTEPVDLALNLAPTDTADLLGLVRPGGVLVSATTPAKSDPAREVRGIKIAARGNTARLAHLVAEVDAGRLHIDVGDRRPLTDLAAVHRQGPSGRTLLLPA